MTSARLDSLRRGFIMINQYLFQLDSLSQLGWNHFFQQQLSLEEWEGFFAGRIVEQERSEIRLLSLNGLKTLKITNSMPQFVVGDWLLLNADGSFNRLLERSSLFKRKAAGTKINSQLIAANIDTMFIVSSLNQDFNLNRIERYLILANEAMVEVVIVLTKLDRCDDSLPYLDKIRDIDPLLNVLTVNALEYDSVMQLEPWCGQGKTVALLGSSGVGKSTLVNTLVQDNKLQTNSIREDDAKGRHTTTSRSMHMLPSGGLILDTPGMRELQLFDCEQGLDETFSEISDLVSQCKFSDCNHENEPGCAVREAIEDGSLDQRRLANYQKLMREQEHNSATIAEKRAKERDFGRHVRSVIKGKQKEKGR